jgi:dTDP-4-amino-4,6-dideoxygalactose transaminase
LPSLKLGVTEFDPQFPLQRMSRVSAGMLPRKLGRLKTITAARARKAAYLRSSLSGLAGFQSPEPPEGCSPSYIRFPVLARDQQSRDWAVQALRRAGIGASAYYPAAICDVPGIEPHLAANAVHRPGAEDLAKRLMTLPLHPMVRDADLKQMIAILRRYPN